PHRHVHRRREEGSSMNPEFDLNAHLVLLAILIAWLLIMVYIQTWFRNSPFEAALKSWWGRIRR
ncbi:hypothetical protein, partial [Staphylococcus aureus]